MKKLLTLLVLIFLSILSIGNIGAEYNPDKSISSDDKEMFCPEYYAPVCAQPPMPKCPEGMMCIQVMPEPKTYSNECFAGLENAEILYEGRCENEYLYDEYIDYSDTSKIMHPSWDLNRDGINDCEAEGTCDHTTDYTKARTYSNSEDFLEAEGHICKSATDGCNTIQIWNGSLGGTTKMYCDDVYGEGGQEEWSCLAYEDEKTSKQKETEEYIKKNIHSLVSTDAVLGGSWYVVNFEWIDEKNVKVTAEEGHIQDEFTFNVDDINMEDEMNMVMCTMEYAPVCGVDGKTYSNRCVAEQQNKVEVAYVGECRVKTSTLSYVDRDVFKKYAESNKNIPNLLKYIERKALERASEKLEQKIETTKLQRIARWVQERRITSYVFLKGLIDREINKR